MAFVVRGLDCTPFRHLFGLDAAALAAHGAMRKRVDAVPGYPDRVSLEDAPLGSEVLLLHHVHHDVDSPFRASHAIYVAEREAPACEVVDQLPQALHDRLLSLRAFDAHGMLVDADVVEGAQARPLIRRLLANQAVAYLHAHYARPGCYAARIDRN